MKMWIARNEDGTLALFNSEPMCFCDERLGRYWAGRALYLSRYEFPEVTFENSPKQITLILDE